MRKPKVVFAFVEAGMGHIMPLRSIADAFEKKYSDKVECVRSNFFTESNEEELLKFENLLTSQVVMQNNHNWYGKLTTLVMDLVGTKIASDFVMKSKIKGAYEKAIKRVDDLDMDLMVSTHWASNYYAIKSKTKPLTVMYCPDAHVNPLFSYECDLALCSMITGYEHALKKRKKRFNSENFKLVPFSIRKEAFEINLTKEEARKKIGIDENKFTIVLVEGGYGIGKMEKICELAVEKDLPVTLIPICGKNQDLYNKFSKMQTGKNTTLLPLSFTPNIFEYIIASDLFCGKSGSMIAEPCFFGVPQIITKHTTNIEKHIAEYYVNYVKSAINEFNPKKIIKIIESCLENPHYLDDLKENCKKVHDRYGSEKTADLIYELLKKKYPELD